MTGRWPYHVHLDPEKCKKEPSQHPAILTSHKGNNTYIHTSVIFNMVNYMVNLKLF